MIGHAYIQQTPKQTKIITRIKVLLIYSVLFLLFQIFIFWLFGLTQKIRKFHLFLRVYRPIKKEDIKITYLRKGVGF